MERQPKFIARVKYTLALTEEREILVPVYEAGTYTKRDVIAEVEKAALDHYYEVISEQSLMLEKLPKLSHQVIGFMPVVDGAPDPSDYVTL